ncbi:MAG: thiol reductase thioredoxin [Bacteroidales bacterium]|nr:thiol reductase thioredoxin [Bacteroidales bacterium]
MKKYIILICLIIASYMLNAQEINKIEYDEIAEENILMAYCNKEGFTGDDFNYWFQDEYKHYTIDKETLELLNSDSFSSLHIKAVMGTWCEDSQREIPRIIKILDHLDYNFENLTIIGVDKNKEAEGTKVDQLNIELVPTIIFYIDNKEIGRIIESPTESLEKDITNIIIGN